MRAMPCSLLTVHCARAPSYVAQPGAVTDLKLLVCPQLRHLDINFNHRLLSLEGLQACGQLDELNMRDCWRIKSLAPLSACANLERLNIADCTAVSSLQPLSTRLKRLDMSFCCNVTSLAPLSACGQLKRLYMRGCTKVASVQPLLACTQLEELVIGSRYRGTSELAALQAALLRLRIQHH
jgi:Leucine-rich repeat (LRR) protein